VGREKHRFLTRSKTINSGGEGPQGKRGFPSGGKGGRFHFCGENEEGAGEGEKNEKGVPRLPYLLVKASFFGIEERKGKIQF